MPQIAQRIIDSGSARDEIWWRGHADVDWELLPAVFRPRHRNFERELALRFMRRAKTRHSGVLPASDAWPDWLFLMQHYGLPTRLLDWSRSPFVASVFAVESGPDRPGAIWAISPTEWNYYANNTQRVIDAYEDVVLPYFKAPFGYAACEARAIAVDVPEIDNRMLIQQAACTIHGEPTPMERLDEFGGAGLIKFILPAELKDEAKQYLALHGVIRDRLFPDLESLARELCEELRNRTWNGRAL